MTSSPCCPRDGAPLATGTGALGEDVCVRCQGRMLDAHATLRLFCEALGIRDDVLRELARDGGRKTPCPACQTKMSTTIARGVQVDLCPGCGGCWLDAGELQRIGGDFVHEVVVANAPRDDVPAPAVAHVGHAMGSGLELDRSTRRKRTATLRLEVRCTSCDEVLDLTTTNWLVNTRPWCAACAAPHVSMFGEVTSIVGRVVGALFSGRNYRRLLHDPTSSFDGLWDKRPDVLRVQPDDVDRFFASFFTRAR